MDISQVAIIDANKGTRVTLIAALDRHRAIGKGNALPWHLPDDLKRFKALTLGKPVLMGRKTAQSLGRALPKRRNLVLTRSGHAPFAGMETIASLDAALAQVKDEELCVIGGGEVFALALPLATRMHLTFVDTVVDGAEAFFPLFDASRWSVTQRDAHPADAKHAFAFEFVDYEAKT
ncbi:MAG: dihydrofolate reductase [Proteobacteria bacterium]|nr:dihydrofolate reductase [Pseudomonadota bacterium]